MRLSWISESTVRSITRLYTSRSCAQEISPKALDVALGDGPKLTELVREAASNPHKEVEFHTSWDLILGRGRSCLDEKIALEELRNDKARNSDREKVPEHDRGDRER